MQFFDLWPGRVIRLMAIFLPCQAFALCEVASTSPAGFGSLSSIAVRTTLQTSSTTHAGLSCTGSLVSPLASDDHFYVTITSATAGVVGPTSDVIGYTLFANNSSSYPITRGVAFDFARHSIIDDLGLLSNPTVAKAVPIYLNTIIGSNVAAGIYSETLNIFWSWDYCHDYGGGGSCQGRDINSGSTSLTVNMTVDNDCTITAPNISFGSASAISSFSTVTGHDDQPGLHQGQCLHGGAG
ncbi:spore coat protein U-like protein [Pseudomonas sp. F-14 TE3931]